MLNVVLIVIQVLASLTLIFLILLHSGRGGGLSDMFGGGQLGGSMAGSTVVERNLDRLTVHHVDHLPLHHRVARACASTDISPARRRLSSSSDGRARAVSVSAVVQNWRLDLRTHQHGVASAITIGGEAGGLRCRRHLDVSRHRTSGRARPRRGRARASVATTVAAAAPSREAEVAGDHDRGRRVPARAQRHDARRATARGPR